jgi:hypothetical protein
MGRSGHGQEGHQEGPLCVFDLSCFSWTRGCFGFERQGVERHPLSTVICVTASKIPLDFGFWEEVILRQFVCVDLFCQVGGTWDLSWKYPLLFCFSRCASCVCMLEPGIAGRLGIASMRAVACRMELI